MKIYWKNIFSIIFIIIIILCVILFFKRDKKENKINEEKNTQKIEITNIEIEEENIIIEEENYEIIIEEEPYIQEEYIEENQYNEEQYIYGYLTHYGPDCIGCSGVTAAGYNVNNTIYYNDYQYGEVRIVAMSSDYPFYSIIRINNYKYGDIIAIVLDRGGAIVGNKVDLLTSSEYEASSLGIQNNIEIEVLRWGN